MMPVFSQAPARSNLLLLALCVLPIGADSAHAAGAMPDLSGIYWATEYHAKIEPVGGGELPFTEAGRAVYEANMAGLADGSKVDPARKFCTPDGPARALATPYPFEIVQAPPGQVMILYEVNHQIRIVQLDEPLPDFSEVVAYPWHNGHSVGHYEGETLVVESIGFNEFTFLDATGTPHSDELVATERWRKTSPEELEVVITIHDPVYYTRDWDARFVYPKRDDVRIQDYVCGLPHRDISHIPGVTEAREARQAAATEGQ
jgi:hypothetical protein